MVFSFPITSRSERKELRLRVFFVFFIILKFVEGQVLYHIETVSVVFPLPQF